MMDGEHGDFPEGMTLWRGVCWCQPEAAKSSRLGVSDITRMLLTAPIYPDNIRLIFEEGCMNPGSDTAYIAFEGDRCIASGDLRDVARAAKETLARRKDASVLVFDGKSGPIDIDFRGSVDDVLARLPQVSVASIAAEDSAVPTPRGPGRPKLGVVAREVTLLPRHWEWLAQRPGGASVALRRLVDEARRANKDKDRIRQAQEAAYRFIAAMGENKPHYEEVARALFAGDPARFTTWTASWPTDVRDHARRLAAAAFERAALPEDATG
jgi:uncharacterized protein